MKGNKEKWTEARWILPSPAACRAEKIPFPRGYNRFRNASVIHDSKPAFHSILPGGLAIQPDPE
jgi:hypothetical protein